MALDSTDIFSFFSSRLSSPLHHIDAYSAALDKAVRPEDFDPVVLASLPDALATSNIFLSLFYMLLLLPQSRSIISLCFHSHLSGHPHRILWTSWTPTHHFSERGFTRHRFSSLTHNQDPRRCWRVRDHRTNMSAFSRPYPRRKAGVRYNNNEVYFDTLDAVVNK